MRSVLRMYINFVALYTVKLAGGSLGTRGYGATTFHTPRGYLRQVMVKPLISLCVANRSHSTHVTLAPDHTVVITTTAG